MFNAFPAEHSGFEKLGVDVWSTETPAQTAEQRAMALGLHPLNDSNRQLKKGLRLDELIHAGGFGVVFKATQQLGGSESRRVAVKVWRSAGADDPTLADTKRLAELNHPNIVTLYDAGTFTIDEKHLAFIATELLEQGTLVEYALGMRLQIAERVQLFQRVCQAVQSAYKKGVIHRDIKPGNVLVRDDGTPKLIDFGMSVSLALVDATLTGCGTPGYSCPEQLKGRQPQASDDIYSLGVLLSETVSGRRLFALNGLTTANAIKRQCEIEPDIDPKLDPDLQAIIRRALGTSDAKSYQTVDELVGDIDRFLANKLVEPLRIGTVRRGVKKFWQRNTRACCVAGVLVAAAGIAAVSAVMSRGEASAAGQVAAEEAFQRRVAEMAKRSRAAGYNGPERSDLPLLREMLARWDNGQGDAELLRTLFEATNTTKMDSAEYKRAWGTTASATHSANFAPFTYFKIRKWLGDMKRFPDRSELGELVDLTWTFIPRCVFDGTFQARSFNPPAPSFDCGGGGEMLLGFLVQDAPDGEHEVVWRPQIRCGSVRSGQSRRMPASDGANDTAELEFPPRRVTYLSGSSGLPRRVPGVIRLSKEAEKEVVDAFRIKSAGEHRCHPALKTWGSELRGSRAYVPVHWLSVAIETPRLDTASYAADVFVTNRGRSVRAGRLIHRLADHPNGLLGRQGAYSRFDRLKHWECPLCQSHRTIGPDTFECLGKGGAIAVIGFPVEPDWEWHLYDPIQVRIVACSTAAEKEELDTCCEFSVEMNAEISGRADLDYRVAIEVYEKNGEYFAKPGWFNKVHAILDDQVCQFRP